MPLTPPTYSAAYTKSEQDTNMAAAVAFVDTANANVATTQAAVTVGATAIATNAAAVSVGAVALTALNTASTMLLGATRAGLTALRRVIHDTSGSLNADNALAAAIASLG